MNLENLNNILKKKNNKCKNCFNFDKKFFEKIVSNDSKKIVSGYMRNVNISQFVELKEKISNSKKKLDYNLHDLQIFERDKHTQLLINKIRINKSLKNSKRTSFSNQPKFFRNISFRIINNIHKSSFIFKENCRLRNKHIIDSISKQKNVFKKSKKKKVFKKSNIKNVFKKFKKKKDFQKAKGKRIILDSVKKSLFFITKER